MIVDQEAKKHLNKLINKFNFKVYIFSNRDWPNFEDVPKHKIKQIENVWKEEKQWWQLFVTWRKGVIVKLTKKWLKQNGIKYDKITIERNIPELFEIYLPKLLHRFIPFFRLVYKICFYKDRYLLSKKKEIKFFVEDNLENAIKLANICEIVFLIDYPYNQFEKLPKNILRVKSWKEIRDFMKDSLPA